MAITKHWNTHRQREVWRVDLRVAGRESKRIQRIFETKEDAVEFETATLHTLRKEKYLPSDARAHSLAGLFAAKREELTSRKEQEKSRRLEGWLLAITGPQVRITDLTFQHLMTYRQKREGDGVSPATIKRELTTIAATLHAAPRYFPELAQWRPPQIPYPKNANKRRERLITPEEYRAILDWLLADRRPGEHLTYYKGRKRVGLTFYFALLTGARHGEIDRFRWRDIEAQVGRIRIYQGKTDSVKYQTMTPTLRRILEERRKDKKPEDEYVFSKNGNTTPFYYECLKDACAANNIPYGRNVKGGLITHDTRHTLITMLLENGLDLRTVGSISGHSDQHLILHYSHTTPATRQRAADLIESVFGEKSTEPEEVSTGPTVDTSSPVSPVSPVSLNQ